MSHLTNRFICRFGFRKGYESSSLFNFHGNVQYFTKLDEMLLEEIFRHLVAGNIHRIARTRLVPRRIVVGLASLFLLVAFVGKLLIQIRRTRRILFRWRIGAGSRIGRRSFHRWKRLVLGARTGLLLGTFSFLTCMGKKLISIAPAPSQQNIKKKKLPLGRLKELSCFACGFWIAWMAPLLISFRATSRASRASAGRLGIRFFSGSCLGAFRACSAFFYEWN